MHEILFACSFMLLGLAAGTFGALIGAGGGFALMPVLLLLYPAESPALLASISLRSSFSTRPRAPRPTPGWAGSTTRPV